MTAIIMVVDQAVAMTFWQVVLVQGWHGDKVGMETSPEDFVLSCQYSRSPFHEIFLR